MIVAITVNRENVPKSCRDDNHAVIDANRGDATRDVVDLHQIDVASAKAATFARCRCVAYR